MAKTPATQAEKTKKIQQLLELVAEHENRGRAIQADDLKSLISDIQGGQKDANDIRLNARVKVKKYNGKKEKGDGKNPVEIQEFITEG
jgi:predicted lipid-binding transport protein (Tim44 family)